MSDAATDTDQPVEAEPVEPETAYGMPVTWSRDQMVIHVGRDQLISVIAEMKADGWSSILDLCGVDYLNDSRGALPVPTERFEIVISMIHHARRERIRVRVQVPADDPTVPTLFDLYPGTEAHEREAFDMYGIVFEGHPMLTRILMPEDWEGHPLRKDHAVGAVPVQFKLKGAAHGDPGTREV